MKYVFITFNSSLSFDSPESWFKRTEGYAGVLYSLAKENTVINIKQINYEGDCLHNGVLFHFINFGEKDSYFPRRLICFVEDLEPDVVFIQGLHNPLQLLQLCLKLNKNTKVIVQHHAEKPLNGIKKYILKLADKYVDAYLFASREMGMQWVQKGNLASAQKIHEVMEVSSIFGPMERALAKSKTHVTGDPVFLWVGRLNDNKDPLTVVKAFLQFAGLYPSAHLYMIYHTDELLAEIHEVLDSSPQKDNVVLIGKVPHDELQYWFNSADMIILGSHYEGSGTAVCEAMSCGCMPLVTDIFSFRMITDNGRCGLLYEAGNEAALLSALIKTQQMDIREKQKLSIEHFKATLSFEAIAQKIQEIASSL
jgi:glycosyltransferase involved in cell wall biosynthesis